MKKRRKVRRRIKTDTIREGNGNSEADSNTTIVVFSQISCSFLQSLDAAQFLQKEPQREHNLLRCRSSDCSSRH